MVKTIYLLDKTIEAQEDTADLQQTDFRVSFWPQQPGIKTEIQSQEEQLTGHYYSWNEVPSGEIFEVGGGVTVVNSAAVGSTAIFGGSLTIREQRPVTHFHIWPATWEPRGLTQDSEQLTWDRCRQVLLDFASYAKEILKRKEIAVTDTRIRNWQAIDDNNWKQCILDITVKAESHVALRVWDELTEELQKFINTQPEVIHPFIEDKLSLDVKWV